MNICLVSPLPPPYGGISHWGQMIVRYAAGSDRADITVVDIAPRWRNRHNLNVWLRAFGGIAQMILDISRLVRVLVLDKINVVHLTTSGGMGIVRDIGVLFTSKLFRVPIVYHIRFGRVPQICALKSLEWKLFYFVASRANAVVAIDPTTKGVVDIHIPKSRVLFIPNCVEILPIDVGFDGQKAPDVNCRRVALFVGWVTASKGIKELLEAWDMSLLDGWSLKIIGPGDPDFIDSLKSQSLSNSVLFTGELSHSDVLAELRTCDLFIFPSYTEGFPNAVVEAMMMGKAILATRVGAIPEMLNGCGVVVAPRDTKELATQLEWLASNDAIRTELGGKARKKAVEQYSIESVFNSYCDLWSELRGVKNV